MLQDVTIDKNYGKDSVNSNISSSISLSFSLFIDCYCENRMAQYSTAEAKKEFFLTSDDLHDLPKQSIYCGFGTGAPMKVYDENDLEEAAVSKHGREGLAKKRAAREKRESNKRKREEEAAAAIDPAVAERNMKIVGPKWDLQITSPESVAGTKAELVFGCLPPTGWPGKLTRQNISIKLFYLVLSRFSMSL